MTWMQRMNHQIIVFHFDVIGRFLFYVSRIAKVVCKAKAEVDTLHLLCIVLPLLSWMCLAGLVKDDCVIVLIIIHRNVMLCVRYIWQQTCKHGHQNVIVDGISLGQTCPFIGGQHNQMVHSSSWILDESGSKGECELIIVKALHCQYYSYFPLWTDVYSNTVWCHSSYM